MAFVVELMVAFIVALTVELIVAFIVALTVWFCSFPNIPKKLRCVVLPST